MNHCGQPNSCTKTKRVIIVTNKPGLHATEPRVIKTTHNRIHRHRHYAKRDVSVAQNRMLTRRLPPKSFPVVALRYRHANVRPLNAYQPETI